VKTITEATRRRIVKLARYTQQGFTGVEAQQHARAILAALAPDDEAAPAAPPSSAGTETGGGR
jgi:hypothetical protein